MLQHVCLFSVFACLFVGFLLLFGFQFFYICNSILWLNIRLVKRVGKKYMYLQKKAQNKTKNTHILRFVYICVCFEIKAWKMNYYVGHLSKVQLPLRQYNVIQCFNASFLQKCLYQVRVITVFTVFQLLTDFVCLYNYEF